MGGPSFGQATAEPRAPTTTTARDSTHHHDSGVHEGGPPIAFEDDDPEPPPLVDTEDHSLPPVMKTIVRRHPLTAGRLDRTDVRPATSAPGAPATHRPFESSAFSRPEPPTQPQTWRDEAEGGTAVYRARGSGAPGSAVDFRPPGIPIVIDQRGSTEAMIVEGGLLATIIGAYLSDDEDGRTIAVPDAEPLELGRKHDSPFFDDPFVERYHAALTLTEGGVRVDDFSEANGVYLRATGPVRLENGDRLIIGRNVLRFAALSPTPSDVLGCPNPGWWGRLDLMIGVDSHAMSHPLRLAETILGCDPEATLRFDAATGVVPTHCRIRRDASGSTFVEDLGTGPGTFIRVRSGALVPHDAQLLVGRTLIRLERLHSE